MPVILSGEAAPQELNFFAEGIEFDYDYPLDLDLRPGSDLHKKIVAEVLQRGRDGRSAFGKRHDDWARVDRVLRMYVPAEPTRKPNRKQDELFGVESMDLFPEIIMPTTYAAMEVFLTYMTASFLDDPVFQYYGTGPDDIIGAKKLQLLINKQVRDSGAALRLHTMFRDAVAYGTGFIHVKWKNKLGVRRVLEEDPVSQFLGLPPRVVGKRGVIYEGMDLENIDPYYYLGDPSVPAGKLENAEFIGWIEETNFSTLMGREVRGEGLFNVKYLQHLRGRSTLAFGMSRDARQGTLAISRETLSSSSNPIDVVWMYINLVPEQFDLPGPPFPEWWLFGVANDGIVVQAVPVSLDHGEPPCIQAAPDFDGYSASAISRLLSLQDMQSVIDFMHLSFLQNVRKGINDMFVVDPGTVNWFDVIRPGPFKLIRLRRSLWGRGKVDDGIKQLDVSDITKDNINHAMQLREVAFEEFGAGRQLQGSVVNRGPRISAEATRGARSSAFNRMERAARVIDEMAMQPLARQLAYNTIQLMSEDTWVRLTSETEEILREEFGEATTQNRMSVSPRDIMVGFEIESRSGGLPGSADLQTLIELFTIAAQTGMQGVNMQAFFKTIARQANLKEIDNLLRSQSPPRVVDDEQLLREEEAGNVVPAPPSLATNGLLSGIGAGGGI